MAQEHSENTRRLIEEFRRFETSLNGQASQPLHALRRNAIARIEQRGFPTSKDEEWKYTVLGPLLKTSFRHVTSERVRIPDAQVLLRFPFLSRVSPRWVFVDGHFSEALSAKGRGKDEIVVRSLRSAVQTHGDLLSPYLGTVCAGERNAFADLNTAFMNDGVFVMAERGAAAESPVFILHLSTPGAEPTVSHPHVLVLAAEHATVSVVEVFAGTGDGVYFSNAVTEIVAGKAARIDHYRIQQESAEAFHVSNTYLLQDRASTCSTQCFTFGGALVRNDVHAVMNGEGCETTLNGLTVTGGSQHVDNHTVIDHAEPHCQSHELYKGILDDSSRGVFSGKIIVRKDAQKTDARQTNNNLILSEDAMVDTKPQLEILADDVKCTHGATIGRLDAEGLFYLRSRGIDEPAARGLLTYAFASDLIHRVRIDSLREHLDRELHRRLNVQEESE